MATILVVDDRPINREFLATLLGYAGHQVIEAADATEGLRFARATPPDLSIVDIMMPEIDGFEFVRRLRADPMLSQTRVIFYTATYLEAEMRDLARVCGVEHTIVKPAEPQVILDTVQAALAADAPPPQPAPDVDFDRAHQRVLLDKLGQKVDELELANETLEQRIAERTAELAATNTRLRELNALKDEFVAIAAHDLRSPLGAIQNMADILLEEEDELSPELYRRLVMNIRENARGLIDLVGKLLDLSRMEAGRTQLELMELRVSDIARQSIEVLHASAEVKNISVQLLIAPGEPMIEADPMRLSQIVSNLLSNAIKFTHPGGHVEIKIAPVSEGLKLSVADTGTGIAAEDFPNLFEKFKQTQRRGTAGERGTGLGLALVRQLVELHGGSIRARSEPPRGSTFTIQLPLRGSQAVGGGVAQQSAQ
jgi:signal transduction histidine kinase